MIRIELNESLPKELLNKEWLKVRKIATVKAIQMEDDFEVETLEGLMKGKKGDYLMIGVKGECYPIKKYIFNETYEVIE